MLCLHHLNDAGLAWRARSRTVAGNAVVGQRAVSGLPCNLAGASRDRQASVQSDVEVQNNMIVSFGAHSARVSGLVEKRKASVRGACAIKGCSLASRPAEALVNVLPGRIVQRLQCLHTCARCPLRATAEVAREFFVSEKWISAGTTEGCFSTLRGWVGSLRRPAPRTSAQPRLDAGSPRSKSRSANRCSCASRPATGSPLSARNCCGAPRTSRPPCCR